MTAEDIRELMHYGERIDVEFKEAKRELPKSLWETYSSFANTMGGYIILGVKEHRHKEGAERFEVTGIEDAEKLLKIFWDTINSDKVSRNILMDDDVEQLTVDGQTIVVIRVPMANYAVRPIYLNKNIMGGTFKRNYEGDYHCTDDEVKTMLRDANESGNDGVLVEHYDMDDIDLPTLRAYRHRFEVRNVDHAFNQLDDKEFLHNMGAYTIDRATRREGLTIAGLMMFGKGLPIRERMDNLRMDYIDKTALEGDSRWSDRLTYDGTWENNLYNFFTRTISKLTADLKRPFKMEGMERIDDTPVHKAVREGLTNMLIHADLLITGVLKVEKHDHEFMFSNPGSLKLPIEEIMKGGNSKARNPRIQNMLRMIGYGENIGSGYPTILKTWREQNWRKPILTNRTELRQVDLSLPMMSLFPDEVLQGMKRYYGDNYEKLTAQEQSILAYVWNGDRLSNTELQQLLGINSIEAGKLLHQMVEKQLICFESKNRWSTYFLPESVLTEVKSEVIDTKSEVKEDKSGVKSGVIVGKSEVKSEESTLPPLTKSEKRVYDCLKTDETLTYVALVEKTSLSRTAIFDAIQRLKELQLIRREGNSRKGRWIVK